MAQPAVLAGTVAGGVVVLVLLWAAFFAGRSGKEVAVPRAAPRDSQVADTRLTDRTGELQESLTFDPVSDRLTALDPLQVFLGIIAAIGIANGLVQCFFGYRLFKIALALMGFLLGFALAVGIGYAQSYEAVVVLLGGVLGGFVGAVLMVVFYFLGVFVVGALLGGVLGAVLSGNNPEPAVLLILAVMGGVAALLFQKLMIIVSTSFWGAWMVVTGVAYFVTGAAKYDSILELYRPSGSYFYAIVLCWLALGIAGVCVQYNVVPLTPQEPALRH